MGPDYTRDALSEFNKVQEGVPETYLFRRGRYALIGTGYAVGPEDRTLPRRYSRRKIVRGSTFVTRQAGT
jgi:hypothetical protein